jgi:imidazolonepropionase-like amidohydrolase
LAAAAENVDSTFGSHAAVMFREESAPIESFDPSKCNALMRDLAHAGVRVAPTLTLWQGFVRGHESAALADERLRYVEPSTRAVWQAVAASPADTTFHDRAVLEQMKRLTGLLSRAGVPLLAGTDSPNPFVYPGFGLHEELSLMVASGLTPLQALRTATLNPAEFFGATDSLGRVAPGMVADLVLLDGNPLTSIENTRRIRAVVANGRLYSRSALDSLLRSVEQAVKQPSKK